MKVPYLNQKRKKEMGLLAEDFAKTIRGHMESAQIKPRLDDPWLKIMYHLLALLHLLPGARLDVNPSREYALLGAKATGNRELFLQAMTAFQAPEDVLNAMRESYRRTVFSGFIAELRSDLMMALTQGLIYSYRGAAISLRCALEDLYRHLYYMDHPQEFAALSAGRETEFSMKISPQGLREYLSRTSYLRSIVGAKIDFSPKSDPKDMDWIAVNDDLYSALSSAVHGASSEWFAAVGSAASLVRNDGKEEKLNALFVRFAKLCSTFLIAAHRDVFASLGDYDKSLVFEIYEPLERRNLRVLLNI
ncbi:hypothetical protein [Acidovorax sp.]|uniref:hypothetical protein n=1 Tax=Acidovorax sp. TaxID=1872122 RepID=UPI002ACDF1C5|nr:hypothetical protein [Acidovorax sp.]MDZ7864094.1 hypothetical protein [Acidovorax sp.]